MSLSVSGIVAAVASQPKNKTGSSQSAATVIQSSLETIAKQNTTSNSASGQSSATTTSAPVQSTPTASTAPTPAIPADTSIGTYSPKSVETASATVSSSASSALPAAAPVSSSSTTVATPTVAGSTVAAVAPAASTPSQPASPPVALPPAAPAAPSSGGSETPAGASSSSPSTGAQQPASGQSPTPAQGTQTAAETRPDPATKGSAGKSGQASARKPVTSSAQAKPQVSSTVIEKDRRAAEGTAAAEVVASIAKALEPPKGDESDGKKPTSVVDLLAESAKSFATLMSDRSSERTDKDVSTSKSDTASSTDGKRFANAYAAYDAFGADDADAKQAA